MPVAYQSTSDPRKLAENQRALIQQQGDTLQQQERERAAQEEARRRETADYLGDIFDPMARGEGGYNAEEKAAIELSPEQQQQMVTSAGISAGAGLQAARDAAQRNALAAGASPMGVAAYRARLERQAAGEAGDAMTKARVDTSNAAASRAKTVADTRLGKQTEGLNYYSGQNAQANENAQGDYGRQQQTYATQTGGTNQASNIGLNASQTPSTADKIMGGIGGALKGVASFLDEGGIVTEPTLAVVAENGPEKVVKPFDWRSAISKAGAAMVSQPQVTQTQAPAPQKSGMDRLFEGVSSMGDALSDPKAKAKPAADGAIVTEPTLMMLGEEEPEAVVPLGYRAHAKTRPSMAFGQERVRKGRNFYGEAA